MWKDGAIYGAIFEENRFAHLCARMVHSKPRERSIFTTNAPQAVLWTSVTENWQYVKKFEVYVRQYNVVSLCAEDAQLDGNLAECVFVFWLLEAVNWVAQWGKLFRTVLCRSCWEVRSRSFTFSAAFLHSFWCHSLLIQGEFQWNAFACFFLFLTPIWSDLFYYYYSYQSQETDLLSAVNLVSRKCVYMLETEDVRGSEMFNQVLHI